MIDRAVWSIRRPMNNILQHRLHEHTDLRGNLEFSIGVLAKQTTLQEMQTRHLNVEPTGGCSFVHC